MYFGLISGIKAFDILQSLPGLIVSLQSIERYTSEIGRFMKKNLCETQMRRSAEYEQVLNVEKVECVIDNISNIFSFLFYF